VKTKFISFPREQSSETPSMLIDTDEGSKLQPSGDIS